MMLLSCVQLYHEVALEDYPPFCCACALRSSREEESL